MSGSTKHGSAQKELITIMPSYTAATEHLEDPEEFVFTIDNFNTDNHPCSDYREHRNGTIDCPYLLHNRSGSNCIFLAKEECEGGRYNPKDPRTNHLRPVPKQAEDVCDFIVYVSKCRFGHGYDQTDHWSILPGLEAAVAKGVDHPRDFYIREAASLMVEHRFRRFWGNRPDAAVCAHFLEILTRKEFLNTLVSLSFKDVYGKLFDEFLVVARNFDPAYSAEASHDWQMGRVRFPQGYHQFDHHRNLYEDE